MIRKARVVLFFIALIFLFFAGRRIVHSVFYQAGQIASCFLYPILLVQNKIVSPIKSYIHQRKTMQELESELEAIKFEKEALQAELLALKGTASYHEHIKELLTFKKRYQTETALIGQIIFRCFSPQEHSFLVDQGRKQGVQEDMIAVYNNCLVGRVSDVFPWYSKVLAITDRGCKVAAYCEKTKSCGIHVGSNQLELTILEHVSHLSPTRKGDTIFSSGEGLVFPRGFGIGCIKECTKEGLWHRIMVEPFVNLREISCCTLLHKGAIN